MRKKDILGNYVKNPNVVYSHSFKKLSGETETYAAVINFLPGTRELYVNVGGNEYCLSAAGYKWLMYLPMNEYWCITAFYDPEGKLLQWYFDISKGNFIDENGMPCTDDIFLDLTIYPNGENNTLDADELQDALDKHEITVEDYNHAYAVRDDILAGKWNDVNLLTELCDSLMKEFD